MTAAEIDAYLATLDPIKRGTLEEMRRRILLVIPEAEQGISYAVPAFRVKGKVVAGLAAFKNHLAYLPHSGGVLGQLSDELQGYGGTKSSLHFPVDEPLSQRLVELLVRTKMHEAGLQ